MTERPSPVPGRLTGQTAIVTGAAQGIGRAIARRLAAEGANVVVADVQAEAAERTAAELDAAGDAVAVECDVTSLDDAEALAAATRDRFGRIDVLVNNAGVGGGGDFPAELPPEDWHHVLDVNLTGAYNCCYAAVPSMIEAGTGRVINVSSMAGRNISYHGTANYTASKWGLIGLTKHLAWDLGEHGIRVNAICPGVVLTPLADGQTDEERAATAAKIPLGRWSEPEEQAAAVAFLASGDAAYLTGTVIEIDGGLSLGPRREI
ncbi:MAG: SDR family NAD(P)-dependent oxidoreductase [Halobacteriales archaeon]